MRTAQWKMDSMVGPIYLVASEKGLQEISWRKKSNPFAKTLSGSGSEVKILRKAVDQLNSYFAGERTKFDLPVDISGTPFQMQVWNQLKKIPYGKTHSYSDVALAIKNGKAVRAVGTANGRNPLSIIVPCHRVIAADGTLGGYAGGLDIKTKLLNLEKSV